MNDTIRCPRCDKPNPIRMSRMKRIQPHNRPGYNEVRDICDHCGCDYVFDADFENDLLWRAIPLENRPVSWGEAPV